VTTVHGDVRIARDGAALTGPRKGHHVLADFGGGQILLGMIYFFFLFAFIWILITVLMDLFRDHTLSGVAKTIWVIVLVLLPLIGTLIYLIARGGGMQERAMEQAKRQQQAMNEYIRQTAAGAGASPADQIAQAQKLLDAGTITQEEFAALKAKALA
jgi:ABC-type multidrug transport system fused ATPase/permease subunit